jgi:two-component system chemotaxis sensor kinase CheA
MNEELLREFLIESYENLDRLDKELIHLEQDPHDQPTLASVFRTIHTIKGSCGFLEFSKLEAITHAGENLLSMLRDGDLALDADVATALLGMVDAIRAILALVESTGGEGDGDYSSIVSRLTLVSAASLDAARREALNPTVAPALESAMTSGAFVNADIRMPAEAAIDLDRALVGERRIGPASDSSLRIDVSLLDSLMTLVGELVLARNQLLQFRATQADAGFHATTHRLNLVTSELQEAVMKTRMQPIGNVWSKFPRIVRDAAAQRGKQVRLEMEGKETELDKTIIEAIKDPLTHILRNSIDHGIEPPDVRLRRGKPAEGRIRLHARHENGQINIEMSDDGGGIDPAVVAAKAMKMRLITSEQANRLSNADLVRLVFLPGLTTAQNVSSLSGRGVGMDVVKTNIERIGGQVDIRSTPGEGTHVRIAIPLTLAIIPALLVTGADRERYAIPQPNLLELVRLEGPAVNSIERVQNAMFYRLRGNLLPLVSLNDSLALTQEGSGQDVVNIVVLKADQQQFGLIVDGIGDTEEIVVKPLSPQLKGTRGFAGATITGDGRVVLILDVLGIAERASLQSNAAGPAIAERREAALEPVHAHQQNLLLFRIGESARMAVDLRTIARLEEFPSRAVERTGDQDVVQYRGQIMPLADLRRQFNHPGATDRASIQVVVCSFGDRSVGLIVDQILDVVSGVFPVQYRNRRPGILGSVVIREHVTDLLDAQALLRQYEASLLPVAGAA